MDLSKATMTTGAVVFVLTSLGSDAGALTREATCRKVAGVITEVDAASMAIAPTGKPTVRGHIDARTRVVIDGQASKPGDLRVTYNAKGQLCLDDVWTLVTADTKN